jgi:hypothetical protein
VQLQSILVLDHVYSSVRGWRLATPLNSVPLVRPKTFKQEHLTVTTMILTVSAGTSRRKSLLASRVALMSVGIVRDCHGI